MTEQKTSATEADVNTFLQSIDDERKRADSQRLSDMMQLVTGEEPTMWPGSMVGFGRYRYRYASGHEGETFKAGFAPRKSALTIYLGCDATDFQQLLDGLGKHKLGKGCLYIKKLEDVDQQVLEQLLTEAANAVENSPVRID